MRRQTLVTVAVPAAVFLVYLLTLYPTVGWVDCGEISAGCYMLNVLHPTGYPLFTLLGYLFSHLPVGNVVTRVNALSALCSSLAALLCLLTVAKLSKSLIAGIIAAALFAFSSTVWSNSVDADVFGLTALYVALTIFLLVRFRESPRLLFILYLLGLALTNHMSYASTFVGSVVYLLIVFRGEVLRPRVLAPLAALFLLGLSPYAYLLIRSQAQPLLNWGNAHNLERLLWHVTGKQYQVWMFSLPFSDIIRNLGLALGKLGQELYFIFVPALLWGAVQLFRKRREVFWLLSIVFALNILYAVNYSIPDIQSYYIPFMTAAFIATGVGMADIMKRLNKVPRYVFLLLCILPPAMNYRKAGAQGNYIAEDFGRNHMKSAPSNAIVMTTNWDVYSPAFYLRHINRERPDLCMIDKELLRRSWYFQSLQHEYPWLVERSQPEIDRYLGFLDQFEHNTLRDVKGIQDAFIVMISSFVTKNPERRTFMTFDERSDRDAKEILPGRQRIPYGLLYEVSAMPRSDSFDFRQFAVRIPNLMTDERTRTNLSVYERMAGERAVYLMSQGRREEAVATVGWALAIFPKSGSLLSLKTRIEAQR